MTPPAGCDIYVLADFFLLLTRTNFAEGFKLYVFSRIIFIEATKKFILDHHNNNLFEQRGKFQLTFRLAILF
jgi:hypothetical protein